MKFSRCRDIWFTRCKRINSMPKFFQLHLDWRFSSSNSVDIFCGCVCVCVENYNFYREYMLWFERLWSAKTIRINGNVHKKEAEKSTRKKNRSEIEGRTFHLFDIWNVIKWLWLRLIRIVCHMNNVSFVIEEWIPFMGVDSDTSTANKSQYIMRNSMNWRR